MSTIKSQYKFIYNVYVFVYPSLFVCLFVCLFAVCLCVHLCLHLHILRPGKSCRVKERIVPSIDHYCRNTDILQEGYANVLVVVVKLVFEAVDRCNVSIVKLSDGCRVPDPLNVKRLCGLGFRV